MTSNNSVLNNLADECLALLDSGEQQYEVHFWCEVPQCQGLNFQTVEELTQHHEAMHQL